MLKRLSLAFAGLFAVVWPAFAAGTIPYSLSQQLDKYGKPLTGCKLYVIQAGTTNAPQNAYSNAALTLPLPNPLVCDAAGRLSQFFVADGTIKVRLTDKFGVTQVEADGIQVIGPSGGGGGGGGGTIDATTVLATGDVKSRYGTGILAGFVRMNGRTIGSSTSGASERANSDTQLLFEYLWNNDTALAVSGGRGASSNADWVANKTITLPDGRGKALAGVDSMGSSYVGWFNNVTFSRGDPSTLGSTLGVARQTLGQLNLPAIAPTFTGVQGSVSVTSSSSTIVSSSNPILQDFAVGGSGSLIDALPRVSASRGSVVSSGNFTPNGTISALGSSLPFDTVSPLMLVTMYMKL